jgi:predicted heme/steroid binding protein
VLILTLVVMAQLVGTSAVSAATPASGTVGPANGSTTAWDFAAVGPGVSSGGTIEFVCPPAYCDSYTLNVALPSDDATFYATHSATLELTYTWNSTGPDDMDIFAFAPDGTESGPGSPDAQSTGPGKEVLDISNPQSGAWTIESYVGVTDEPTVAHTVAKLTYATIPAVTPPPTREFASPVFTDVSPGVHYETSDVIGRANAGEPSVGLDWRNQQPIAMYMAGTQVSKVTFNFGNHPPTATWTDVTPAQQQEVNEDAILFVDQGTKRTFATGLLVAGSNQSYSDDDGATWNQGTFPEPHSPDHETVAGGPYASPIPPTAGSTGYPNAAYYCSQNIVQAAGSFCARSDTGSTTWNPSVDVFGATSPCGSISGHLKVAFDGTVYLPQLSCTHSNGSSGQGGAVSIDNGQTWSYFSVPGISARPPNAGTDPAIGIGAKGSVYFGAENGNGHPMIAVSHDRGHTWSTPVDVGIPFGIQNTKFPEVVAGDDNRAAFAFLGTSTAGDDQSAKFLGVWHLYVAETFDSGKHWVTVDADPGSVIQRGCIWNGGGSNACRNMLDFNDIGVDHNGRVYVAFTDGCKDINFSYSSLAGSAEGAIHGPSNCESDPNSYADTDKVNFDGLVMQTCGESLYERHDKDFADYCPAPRVSSVSPPNGSTNVPRSVTPSATFDEAPTTTYSFKLMTPSGTLVPGTLVCGRECHKLTFVPTNKLAANTTYTAVAKLGNAEGVATAKWHFTTGST